MVAWIHLEDLIVVSNLIGREQQRNFPNSILLMPSDIEIEKFINICKYL